ncbi:MAG: transglutaminase domain-containing protein [Firmicutes bacterium]|nr:transglutaminase domain-containing protein [Bacillota bacterium]
MARRLMVLFSTLCSIILLGWPLKAWAQETQVPTSVAMTALPAYYAFTKSVTITNRGKTPAYNIKAQIVLLAPKSQYAHVTLVGSSMAPTSTFHDQYGNLIGVFTWPELPPGQSLHVVLHYEATSSDISYRLPSVYPPYNTHSRLYRFYTSPRLEAKAVDTDAPPIEALDRALVGSLHNPYLRAKILFDWVVQHIHYNYSLKPSGSALATLRTRLGICSDIAELYVSMLRTDHIPAELVDGYVTNNGAGQGGFHEWVQFYLPGAGWIVADPTWGHYGYFAALQDDWHIPLYDGIRPDISVQWQYVNHGPAKPVLSIHYDYHFVTEQGPPVTRRLKLPLIAVAPPVAQEPGTLSFSERLRADWQHVVSFFHLYLLRARIVWESL